MLPLEEFKATIQATPLVSIDLIVRNTEGKILLGKRVNRPAQGYWFVPGGRVLKDETLHKAFSRILKGELGIDMVTTEFKGVYQHFYEDNFFDESSTTHYIVLAYELKIKNGVNTLPLEQHSSYKWFTGNQIVSSKNVHPHTKWYFQENRQAHADLLSSKSILNE